MKVHRKKRRIRVEKVKDVSLNCEKVERRNIFNIIHASHLQGRTSYSRELHVRNPVEFSWDEKCDLHVSSL